MSARRSGRSWFPVRTGATFAALLGVAALDPAAAAAADCYFSSLAWSADASHLSFLAGPSGATRRLRLDLVTGSLECLDPQVHEPCWSEAGRRVIFRDRFGIFEVRPDEAPGAPRLLVFLPDASRHFLRAFGADDLGRLLLWTYDRVAAAHCLWTLGPGGLEKLPGQPSGPEALRVWQGRDVAQRFERAGGRFARSVCLQRPRGTESLCLEQTPAGGDRHAPALFRLTLGAPTQVQVLIAGCAPAALAADADSSRVLVDLFESVDAAGTSASLGTWILNWREGHRVHESSLPAPADVGAYHDAWVLWSRPDRILWADAAGELLRLDSAAAAATELVPVREPGPEAALYRVVAWTGSRLAEAQAVAQKLRAAGGEAGILEAGGEYEVQAAVLDSVAEAAARAASLHLQGFAAASVRQSGPQDVGAGLGFGVVAAPDGRSAQVRNVQGDAGRFSEIWLAAPHGEPRQILASFETLPPRAWP